MRERPREAVGAFVGRGWAERAVPLVNAASDPYTRYLADPAGLLRLFRELDERGEELVAFYHSHPFGLARPSEIDRQEARWPVPYVIFGLAEGAARAYLLPEDREVPLEVVDGA